ncbi:OmpP1/FadL family transporter [Sphingobacterium haloxyli]|uniref:Hemin receptor n=1 Tax=Sphingobacterium haloxyli TaxID=2100533 RepID=A0A2S9J0K3_9SPHI|nr:hypothetical protein [Sphingobacterium haloxyli]PRD46316.1 hypothetical protein C5745_16160 [Sphingobacterium haloxyli]
MRIKNILFTSLLVSGISFSGYGQSVGNGLIFSQENNGGSARFRGLGNANTALGGDISSITGNPAGLGFFSQSDISVTFNYNNAANKGTYFGNSVTRNKGRFGVDQAGVVFHFPKNEGYYGWQNFNVGIGYENTNRFSNNVRYEGINPDNSIVGAYTDDIADFGDQALANSLYDIKLIERFADTDKGYFPMTSQRGNKDQISDILTTGNSFRTSLAFGGNYNNVFYIGGNIGFSSFIHENSAQFSEYGWTKDAAAVAANNPNSNFIDPTHPDYDFLNANYEMLDDYYQRSEGTGVDFKIGAIYKPTVDWNIGATITSPTWYTIDQYTESYIGVDYYDNENAGEAFDFGETEFRDDFSYRLITPWKFGLGVSKFFGRGLVTADAEYVNHANIKVRDIGRVNSSDDALWDEDFKAAYKGAVNLRIGGEYLITNTISGRAGINYFGNPYKNADNTQYSGSLGLGTKLTNTLYLDLAVVHSVNDYKVSPYLIDEEFWDSTSPVADIKHQRTNVVLTLGAKF